MKHLQQRANSKTDEDLGSAQFRASYTSFQNDSLPGEESSTDELEFVNPVFKQKIDRGISNLGIEEDYDKLSFDGRLSDYSPSQRKNQQQEEIEMGTKGKNNYGYVDDFKRAGSYEGDSSAVSPYSLDTVNRNRSTADTEMSESLPRQSSLARQPYSAIVEQNSYTLPLEKGPQYEDLNVLRNKYAGRSDSIEKKTNGNKKANILYEQTQPKTNGGGKKGNALYESTNFAKTHKNLSYEEASRYEDENSNCCHVIFTIVIGLLAIAALLIIFLLVFGAIKLDCKDCQESTSGGTTQPITGSQLEAQLQNLEANLTSLKHMLKSNTSNEVKILREELEQYKNMVQTLATELNTQRNLTAQLNERVSNITVIQGLRGPAGPPGLNGTQGPPGPPGLNLSSCVFETADTVTRINQGSAFSRRELASENRKVIAATCSTENFLFSQLSEDLSRQRFKCLCTNRSSADTNIDSRCQINYWHCLNATNITTVWPISLQGDIGPVGMEGFPGPVGLQGSGLNVSNCFYVNKTRSETVTSSHSSVSTIATILIEKDMVPVGAQCSSATALQKLLKKTPVTYLCECRGVEASVSKTDCTIDLFYCKL